LATDRHATDAAWETRPGLAVSGRQAPAHAVEWARAAEAAGLGSVWLIEDYFQPGAFALAGAVAAATTRLVVGIGVVNPYTRHPALLAMETAALAGLAPGRVVLGLGTSNRRWIEDQMGIPFKAPLGTLRECVDVVRRLLAGERVTATGVHDVALEGLPPAPVPIYLGVKAPKALRLAGEIADGLVCSILSTPAHVRRARTSALAARAAAPPASAAPRAATADAFPVLAYVPVMVADTAREARERVRPFLARYLHLLHGQSILRDAGVPESLTQRLRDAAERGERATDLVTDEWIGRLAVAGTPDDCRAALAPLAAAGLDAPIALPLPGVDVTAQIARWRDTIVPAWGDVIARRPSAAGERG
jgi:5,10-methylenetetrahydromethanopterin reductase